MTGYQHQIDRAEATLDRIAANLARTENLLAAILDTLVAMRPEPMPKRMPSVPGAHYAAAFPLVSNPQDRPGDADDDCPVADLEHLDAQRAALRHLDANFAAVRPAGQVDTVNFGSAENLMEAAIPLPPARPAGSLHMIGPLADPIGTPGAVHPDYTEADIDKTIRIPGWTSQVRPPTSYTTPLKEQSMREYGYPPDTDPTTLELDHKVPLCCLGHPTSQLNLYPQPREGQWGAKTKDLCEVAAQHAILTGAMSLKDVQAGFMGNWVDLHMKLFTNPTVVASMMAMAMKPPEDEP